MAALCFRCPHCQQNTIGIQAKLKAGEWWPGTCPECGGKFVPSAWGGLLSSLPFFLLLFAPLLVAGSASPTLLWILFGVGAALGLAASVAAYLFLSPILPHRSRSARWEFVGLVAVIVIVVFYAALTPDESSSPLVARHFRDPAAQAAYKAALQKAGIPFTVYTSDGREYVRVAPEHAADLERVQKER